MLHKKGGHMNKQRGLKLGALLLMLALIIGVGVYISGESHSEDVILPESTKLEKEGTGVTGVNPVKPFYYQEMYAEDVLEDRASMRIFFRYKDAWVKAVPNGEVVQFFYLNSEEVAFSFPEDLLQNTVFDLTPDGFIWTASYLEQGGELLLNKYSLEGALKEEVVIKEVETFSIDGQVWINQLRVESGNFYVLGETHTQPALQVYNSEGQLKYTHLNVSCFDVHQTGDFVLQKGESTEFQHVGYFGYRISDGSEYMRNEKFSPLMIRFNLDYTKLLVINETVMEINPETGRPIMTVLEFGKDSSFLLDNRSLSDTVLDQKNSLKILLSQDEVVDKKIRFFNRLYTFEKMEGNRSKRETTVVLTVPYRSDYISEAIKRYEMLYPKEHIEYDYAYNTYEEFMMNREEYGQKLALRIIGNEVGDLVQTGGSALRFWPLAQTDVFMDLEPLLKADPIYENLNQSVLEGMRINNSIRALPVAYQFYQYEFNRELGQTLGIETTSDVKWSEALSWIEKLDGSAKWMNDNGGKESVLRNTLESILVMNMPDLVDLESKTVNLNQDWFKALIKQYKSIYNSEQLVVENPEHDLVDRLQGALLRLWTSSSRLGDGFMHFSAYNELHHSTLIPCIRGEISPNRIAYSKYMYSINERSEHKESAWQFLKFLADEEMQQKIAFEGAPINNQALNRLFDKVFSNHRKTDSNMTEAEKHYIQSYLENSKKVNFMFDMDYMKNDISVQVDRYVKNEINLEEALENAEKSIMIRLNE